MGVRVEGESGLVLTVITKKEILHAGVEHAHWAT